MSRSAFSTLTRGAAALLLVTAPLAHAQTVRNLAGFRTNTLQANDDGSTAAVNLGFGANFFGTTYTSAFVNNNGNVTFGAERATFTPFGLTTNTGIPIIAAYFADVDTRGTTGAGSSGGGSNELNTPQPFAGSGLVTYGNSSLGGRNAFGVNWFSDCANWSGAAPGPASCAPYPNGQVGVGYFDSNADRLNIFQLILIDRSDVSVGGFDIEFNYNQIQWETGGASGGTDGLGGNSARVGYSSGSGAAGTFFEQPGSGVNGAFLDTGPTGTRLVNATNIGVPGRLYFSVRAGEFVTPDVPTAPVTTIPEPSTFVLALGGLLGVFGVARRRRA
jgi:hypothetical protein